MSESVAIIGDAEFEAWFDKVVGIERKKDGTPRIDSIRLRERMRAAYWHGIDRERKRLTGTGYYEVMQ